MSSTGWRASSEARRPHTKRQLKRRPPSTTISKKRRTSVKDSNAALRRQGLL